MNIGVIGGGASGIMAAITAAREGAGVTVLERMNRVGKKILATGNGRCNLTNTGINVSRYHGKHHEFCMNAFKEFGYNETINFFEDLGIVCKNEYGKIYPMSDQASAVLDVLRFEMQKLNINEECEFEAASVKKKGNVFAVYSKDGRKKEYDRVIIAAGGKASPNLGSNGSGLDIALSLGHKIIEPLPALVQLKLNMPYLKSMKGIKFIGRVRAGCKDKTVQTEDGEILYTDYGISGPPVLQLSGAVVKMIDEGLDPWIEVDMFPDIDEKNVEKFLSERFKRQPLKSMEFSLIGLINKRLIVPILKCAGVSDIHKECKCASNEEILKISEILKRWKMPAVGSRSWTEAQVTSGGVDTSEINPDTMESKIVKHLYMAGEIVDIDGDCGGFNLQWAWSSGHVAGLHAAKDK